MYQILIKKRAKKFIDKLPATDKRRVVEAIERLPEGEDIKKLRGYEQVLRLRVGPYRIIYEVDNGSFFRHWTFAAIVRRHHGDGNG